MPQTHHFSNKFLREFLEKNNNEPWDIVETNDTLVVTVSPVPDIDALSVFERKYIITPHPKNDGSRFFTGPLNDRDPKDIQSYQIDKNAKIFTLYLPLKRTPGLENRYLAIESNTPLSFLYDLRKLLDTRPPPEPKAHFLILFWQAFCETLIELYHTLLGTSHDSSFKLRGAY